MSWLNRIFNAPAPVPEGSSPSTGFFDIEGQPVPLSLAAQDVREARELIRAAAIRTTAAFGIPSNWMSYEVVTISDDEKAYFQLQVSLRIWDELLWAQSSAYEKKVLKRIREDDSNVARAVRAVLWRVLPDAGCPYDELASAAAWRPEAIRVRSEVYERVRDEFARPILNAPPLMPSADPESTLPLRTPGASQFGDTLPVDNSGFEKTRPIIVTAPTAPESKSK
jgi:hypothetical protein